MQKARRHPSEDRLRPLVSVRFQVLFTSLIGELFIIQSPYWFAIGRPDVFSLGGWALRIHTEFHGLGATLVHLGQRRSSLQDFHLLWWAFPDPSRAAWLCHVGVHNPIPKDGLGYSAFARRY